VLGELRPGGGRVAGGEHAEARDGKEVAQQRDDFGLVLDHQHRGLHPRSVGARRTQVEVFAESSALVQRLLA